MPKNFFSKLKRSVRLTYPDIYEEKEFFELKAPFTQNFFMWLFAFTAILFVPLTFRYFSKDLYPQSYLGIAFIIAGVLIFLFRHKLRKFLEMISFLYISLIVALYIVNMREVLRFQSPIEAFYMGYGFALIQRMLDYRVSRFPLVVVFNGVCTIVKFTLVLIPDAALAVFVIFLEIFPMVMSYRIEKAERSLFDSLYKSKNQLMKFKDFLTQYLPNPMTILSQDTSETYFLNNSFKQSFDGQDNEAMSSLDKLLIDLGTINKNKDTFELVGLRSEEGDQPITILRFLRTFFKEISKLPFSKAINLQTTKQESEEATPTPKREETASKEEEGGIVFPSRQQVNSFRDQDQSKRSILVNKSCEEIGANTSKLHNENFEMLGTDRAPNLPDRSVKSTENNNNRATGPDDHPTKRVWKTSIFPLLWDNKSAIAVVLDDVTHERTIMELKIADKNKDLVIATVSHELRTPLNGMLGMVDIVKKKLSKLEGIEESDILSSIDSFKNNSLLLLNLVNSILDFSQFNNNKLRLDYGRVDLVDLLAKIKPLFYHFCKSKNLFLNVEIAPDVPQTIKTDQGRLSQIVINLLGNAFKFTFFGGVTVRVTLQNPSPCRIKLSVEDTGIGIKAKDLDKLFKLFGRLDQENNKVNTNGVGLGLTISNTLAKLLNPSQKEGIQVSSELDKGSIFSFFVEDQASEEIEEKDYDGEELDENEEFLEQKDLTHVQEKIDLYSDQETHRKHFKQTKEAISCKSKENKSQDTVTKRKPWCLLVDDNPFNLMIAQNIMEDKGYNVITALNGKEAIERSQEQKDRGEKFDVVLMDCQMPVMDGYEATKILRRMMKEGKVSKCPIIALTANMNDEDQEKLYKEAGMSGYVAKPLRVEKLEEVLKKVKEKE